MIVVGDLFWILWWYLDLVDLEVVDDVVQCLSGLVFEYVGEWVVGVGQCYVDDESVVFVILCEVVDEIEIYDVDFEFGIYDVFEGFCDCVVFFVCQCCCYVISLCFDGGCGVEEVVVFFVFELVGEFGFVFFDDFVGDDYVYEVGVDVVEDVCVVGDQQYVEVGGFFGVVDVF